MQTRHNITLDRDISRELEAIAGKLGEKKSTIIEKALTAYFDLLDLSYRVIFEKREKELVIIVVRIGNRNEVYNR